MHAGRPPRLLAAAQDALRGHVLQAEAAGLVFAAREGEADVAGLEGQQRPQLVRRVVRRVQLDAGGGVGEVQAGDDVLEGVLDVLLAAGLALAAARLPELGGGPAPAHQQRLEPPHEGRGQADGGREALAGEGRPRPGARRPAAPVTRGEVRQQVLRAGVLEGC
jgi:hypothetical protein